VTVSDDQPWRDPSAQPFLRIKGLSKHFGSVAAVDKVSLDIYRGELFCLLGGSGSGKSTLLRMLAGFETANAGSIEIDGQDMAGVPPYRRPVNMMFQSYALFPHMTVADNIAYGLKRERLPRAEIASRVDHREVYEYPNSRFVADFIGSVNLFEGRVSEDGEAHMRLDCADIGAEIYVGHGVSCTPGQRLWVALRPEKVRVSRQPPAQSHNVLQGVVDEIAYMGGSSVLRVRLANGKLVHVTQPNLDRDDAHPVSWDDAVYLSWGDTAGVVLPV